MISRTLPLLTGLLIFLQPSFSQKTSETELRESMQAELDSLGQALFELDMRVWQLENADKSLTIDPTDPGRFQTIRTNYGEFLIVLENVESHLDGIKVSLKIGNPSSAKFSGYDLSVKWGPRSPVNNKDWYSWFKGLRIKQLSFPDDLDPGTWNPVSIILPSTGTQEFGHLEVEMSTQAVSLQRK